MTWYAFQVRGIYDSPKHYKALIGVLCGAGYGFPRDSVFVHGDGEETNAYSGYVFVRTDSGFSDVWSKLRNEKYVNVEDGWLPIPDSDMDALMKSRISRRRIRYGDVALVVDGVYRRLYGIVLDVDDEKETCLVGFNFFTGPRTAELKFSQFDVVKSVFEVWRFPVL